MNTTEIEKHIKTGFLLLGSLLLFAFYLSFDADIWLYFGILLFFIFFNQLIGWHHLLNLIFKTKDASIIASIGLFDFSKSIIRGFFSFLIESISELFSRFIEWLKEFLIAFLKYTLIFIIVIIIFNYFKE